MQKTIVLIALLWGLVMSGCSSTQVSTTSSAVSSTTPMPKCKSNVCVRAVMVTTGEGLLAVRFVMTDQNGKVDELNPPRFDDDNLSFELFRIESNGAEKSIFKAQQSGRDVDCFVSDRFQEFAGQLIGICGFVAPSTTVAGSVQAGDKLKVSLKEFGFEQVITVHEQTNSSSSNKNSNASITDALFMLSGGSSVTTATFPQNQTVIRLVVVVANATADTKVKVVWTAVDVGEAVPTNSEIGEVEQPANGSLIFTMTRPSSGVFPVGKYKADIYLNGTFDRTLEFSVK